MNFLKWIVIILIAPIPLLVGACLGCIDAARSHFDLPPLFGNFFQEQQNGYKNER